MPPVKITQGGVNGAEALVEGSFEIIPKANGDPTIPLAVRLSDGTNFYNATTGGGGGGVGGDVNVTNFPPVQTVDGIVSVSNFPTTQTVAGSVTANLGTIGAVAAETTLQAVRDRLPSTLIAGRLRVDGSAVTQPVSGSVSVSNFPGTQSVSGTVTANAGTGPFPVSDNGGSLTVDGSVAVSNFPVTQSVSGTVAVSNLPSVQPVSDNGDSLTVDGSVAVSNFPATQTVAGTVTANAGTGPFPVSDNGGSLTVDGTVAVANSTVSLVVSQTGTSGSLVTLTLPAAGVGLFHYITHLELTLYATAARTGGATPTTVTSTNLTGASTQWRFPSASAVGTIVDKIFDFARPPRSAVANTATTIVCPGTTSVIWQAIVHYYTGT